jgi:YHS domain-containing protein
MLFKLVIFVIVLYLLFKLLKKGLPRGEGKTAHNPLQKPSAGEDLVEDPVCHTYIPLSTALKVNVDGKTVYFCSQKCLETYVQENKR